MHASADIGERLEACFEEVASTRMAGLPFLNEAISVKAVGGRDWNGGWLCVLVTPWFMNLMLLPGDADEPAATTGTKRLIAFPAGRFEFIAGHEDAIGPYWMCSLFSPVFEFAEQETAEATALAALDALFERDDETDASETAMARMWRGDMLEDEDEFDADTAEDAAEDAAPASQREVSRRVFLRGGVTEESA